MRRCNHQSTCSSLFVLRRSNTGSSLSFSASSFVSGSSLRHQSSSLSTARAECQTLDQQMNRQERATLWGSTSGTFVAAGEAAQEFLARLGYDPVISSSSFTSPVLSHTQEDGLGTDLLASSSSSKLLRESETLWKTERGAQFLSALRRIRARGAGSSVGFARLSSPREATDEADRAETTWSRDGHFAEISGAVHDVTGVAAPNMETLVTAVKRATPEQLVQLHSNFRGLQPYSFLPVPSDAGWALHGEDLAKWCDKVHKARTDADHFNADVLNSAVVAASGWASIAGKLADQYKKICAVEAARRERQVKAGVRREWSDMTAAEQELCAAQDVARSIQSEQTGEYDSAGNEDTSEEFLLEHDQIEKIIDEDLGAGVTLRKFWTHNERFYECVVLQHIADSSSADLRAACLRRARNELGFAQLSKDLERAIRYSTFDNRGHFVTPDTSSRGWRMTRWHLFGASKTVVQHTPSSSRILDSRFQTLEGSAAVAKLYYRLLPLSSSIDLASPFRHRKSLVSVAADFMIEIDRSNQTRAALALRALDDTVEENARLLAIVSSPFGASRRIANEEVRKELIKNDVPLTNVGFGRATGAWKMGSFREVSFEWNTPLLDAHDPQITSIAPGTVDAALLRERLRRQRTCISVALMRKRSKEEVEKSKRQLEEHVVAPLVALMKNNSSTSSSSGTNSNSSNSSYELILRQIQRIVSGASSSSSPSSSSPSPHASATLEQSINLLKKEAESEWEFVTMLDDAVQPYPGDTTFKVRLPFFAHGSASSDYRLDVRCFDLQVNPKRLPTRFVAKSSPAFRIEDPVPDVLKKVARIHQHDSEKLKPFAWMVDSSSSPSSTISANNSNSIPNFSGNLLVDVCCALRKEGVEVPLMLEFDAGQNLTTKGEIVTAYFLSLLSSDASGSFVDPVASAAASAVPSFFKEMGSGRGISDIQLAIEAAVRKHYHIHHPGCTEQEWAENRRSVLETAVQDESEWWRQDSLLQLPPECLSSVASPSSEQRPNLQLAAATHRYARDVVQVLHATGRDGGNQDDASAPIARVSIRGDGATVSLDIDQGVCTSRGLKLDAVLKAVAEASDAALVRLNTLAQAKIGNTQHELNRLFVEIADSTDLGGVYSKTVVKSFQHAERQIAVASGTVVNQLDSIRKDEEPVDRFASKDDPLLRKRLFHARIGQSGENVDDISHDHLDPW